MQSEECEKLSSIVAEGRETSAERRSVTVVFTDVQQRRFVYYRSTIQQ